MATEHRAVARAIRRAGVSDIKTIQTGVGKQAVIRAVERLAALSPAEQPRMIVLAGACGALRAVEDVPRIARVVDEHGDEWPVTSSAGGATLIAVDRVVATPRDKRELADRTGADIVDMESHGFITACRQHGFAWHIIRGVSDTPDETLPDEVLGWIDGAGNSRIGQAMRDMALKPSLVPHIVRVMRRANRVLPLVGHEAARFIAAARREPRTTPDAESRAPAGVTHA